MEFWAKLNLFCPLMISYFLLAQKEKQWYVLFVIFSIRIRAYVLKALSPWPHWSVSPFSKSLASFNPLDIWINFRLCSFICSTFSNRYDRRYPVSKKEGQLTFREAWEVCTEMIPRSPVSNCYEVLTAAADCGAGCYNACFPKKSNGILRHYQP